MRHAARGNMADPALGELLAAMRACRACVEAPAGAPLPHAPRPIFQVSATARIAICSQAPGNRAHIAGRPFYDPSGVRLRSWMGLDEAAFYDAANVAIIPMGFCFPGYDRHGGDLPPRRECVARWHDALFAALPQLELLLCIGRHSLAYHLPETRRLSLTEVVADWRAIAERTAPRTVMALPHPSWRNNAWLARNPWFEAEHLPELRARIAAILSR
ncbi:uracil-DNA glycosylase family protein [Acuticoccus sp.]|uniref:uracil-DNA glycosylase family protein n=1 Tax=Acuticoccus sp. TaxID=1904378 RepID=UPI003B51FBFC